MVKASNNRARGRKAEKEIAKLFNGQEMGLYGGEDVFHPEFSIEVKSYNKFIGNKFMEQCIANNKRQKIPLVVVHTSNHKYEDSLVMVRIQDFLALNRNIHTYPRPC